MEQDLNLIIINSLEGSYISFHESEEEYGSNSTLIWIYQFKIGFGFGLIESLI